MSRWDPDQIMRDMARRAEKQADTLADALEDALELGYDLLSQARDSMSVFKYRKYLRRLDKLAKVLRTQGIE